MLLESSNKGGILPLTEKHLRGASKASEACNDILKEEEV